MPGPAATAPPRWDVEPSVVLDSTPAMFPGVTTTGRGLLASYATTPDGLPGGRIGVVESWDGGRTWQAPRIVVEPDDPDQAAITQVALRRLADGDLLMPFSRVRIRGGYGARQATLHVARSGDDGQSWHVGGALDIDFLEPLTYGAVVETAAGTVLLPFWGRQAVGERWRAAVLRSTDGGRTWDPQPSTIGYDPTARLASDYADSAHNTVDADGTPTFEHVADPDFRPHAAVDGFSETSVVVLGDGTLLAVLRQQGVDGSDQLWLYRSVSIDDGLTWSTPERLGLTGMSPALHRTADGRLLLGYRRSAPDGSGLRPGTVVASSGDAGRTWRDEADLVDPKGYAWVGEYQTGYPDLVDLPGGAVLVVFYSADPALPHGPRYLAANRLVPRAVPSA